MVQSQLKRLPISTGFVTPLIWARCSSPAIRRSRNVLSKLRRSSQHARVFALGKNQLTGKEKTQRFLRHQSAIFRRASQQAGPYVFSISERGLEMLKLFG